MTEASTATARPTAHGAAVTLCTWTLDCPGDAEQRLEDQSVGGGSVEFVCPAHVATARAAGYRSGGSPELGRSCSSSGPARPGPVAYDPLAV